jgi:mono/diheme cytochrome c family protein
MNTPFGYLLAPNLTPDLKTGIGRWSADDFYRALHEGVNGRGQDMFPAMPYDFYTKVTRQDADAIYAYLRTIEPMRNVVDVNHLRFPFNQRWSMAVWRELYFTDETFEADPTQTAAWNRGAYLVEGLGHCGACHSPRNALGAVERDKALTGAAVDGWFALDLTPSLHAGLGEWTADEVASYLKTGVKRNETAAVGPMAEVVQNSTSHLTDADLLAMAEYLKSLPASSSLRAERVTPDESRERGATLYLEYCSGCHRAKGRGTPGVAPALAGNDAVVAQDAANILKVVLVGVPQQGPYVAMPGFADQLSDQQIANIANYVRTNWGNDATPNVTPPAVATLRRTISDASGPAPAVP